MIRQIVKLPLLLWIRMYQWCISPLLGCHCRFSPSCSEYAHLAVQRHGLWRGGWYTLNRLCRCQPFGTSGYDPVPEPIVSTSNTILQSIYGKMAKGDRPSRLMARNAIIDEMIAK